MREKYIEKKVCEYARNCLFSNIKLCDGTGYPDRMFIGRHGFCFFIEFKTPKGVLSEIQKHRIKFLLERGFDCFVVDNIDKGKEIVDCMKIKNNSIKGD